MSLLLALAFAAVPGEVALDMETARKVDYDYAACLLDGDPKNIRGFLLGDPHSRAMARWRRLLQGECLLNPGGLYYTNLDEGRLRMVLADVMIRRKPPAPIGSVAGVPPLVQPAQPRAGSKGEDADYQRWYAWVSRFGECVVRADPAGAAAVLKTRPGSSEEKSTMAEVASAATGCADSGKVEIDVMTFRGTVALNYLRLSDAAKRKNAKQEETGE